MSSYVIHKTPGDTAWFRHDRFGMFIHWGLYAMPARHEWVKTNERIPEEKYDKYFQYFNPDLYDAREWARQAKAAGMKYAVLTTKHHEGFCMWDTQYTDYKCTNTPAGRDLVREYVDAFRAEGLHVGFYYSLIDWHHPDFPIDMLHPRRDDPDAYEQNQGRDMRTLCGIYAQSGHRAFDQLRQDRHSVVRFFLPGQRSPGKDPVDARQGQGRLGSGKADRAGPQSAARHIIIDNRTGIEQDLWTPEQFQPTEWVRHPETGELVNWEACQTFSGSWGYYRDEQTWKSPEMLIRMLVNTVSLGGNLLMNVGPTSRGYFDSRAEKALERLRGLDEIQCPLHLRLHHGRAGVSGSRRLPSDPERGRKAAIRSSVRLSLRPPDSARAGREGGLRPIPARWQRSEIQQRQNGALRRSAAGE